MTLDSKEDKYSKYRDPNYLNKTEDLSKTLKEFFDIMREIGVINALNIIKDNPLEIFSMQYKDKKDEELSDKKKKGRIRANKRRLIEELLGKKEKGESKTAKRDDELIKYIEVNDPNILYPKCENQENNEHKFDEKWVDFMGGNHIALQFIKSILSGRGNFSKTSYELKEKKGILYAICMTIDGKPSLLEFNLNDYIANINGNLDWLEKGNYSDSCTNCQVEKDLNNAYLVCDCPRRNGYMNKSRLNLDKRIDNHNGKLWYVPQLTTNR